MSEIQKSLKYPMGIFPKYFGVFLLAVDPYGQTSKLAYLHLKRINFIEKGQNYSRSPWADLKKGIFALENTKKVCLFLVFWMVSEGDF